MITKADFEKYLAVMMKYCETKREEMLISVYKIDTEGNKQAIVEENLLEDISETGIILFEASIIWEGEGENKTARYDFETKDNSCLISLAEIDRVDIYA